jgi:hypothetical protein
MEHKFMKILFNLLGTGISNNGGSRTLIRSANILKKLGKDVIILNNKLNHIYTWDKIEVPILSPDTVNDIPNADVVIGTGYGSWKKTIDLPNRCGKKFIWCRGWETWNASENKLIELLGNKKIKIITNSIGMQDKLKEHSIESTIIRPGYDFHEIFPLNTRHKNKVLTLGALYSKGSKRSTKRVDWIFKAVEEIKKKMNVCLIMFGSEGKPHVSAPFDLFSPNPSKYAKNSIYNQCDIWLAPTELEALHMPPAEAMQTECCVVGTDAPMSGMRDYLINAETGVESFNTYESFRDCIIYALLVGEETRVRYGKAARKKIQSLGTREYNMNILINYIEDNMS